MAKAKTSSKVTLTLSIEEAEVLAAILPLCSGEGEAEEHLDSIREALGGEVSDYSFDVSWNEDDGVLAVS